MCCCHVNVSESLSENLKITIIWDQQEMNINLIIITWWYSHERVRIKNMLELIQQVEAIFLRTWSLSHFQKLELPFMNKIKSNRFMNWGKWKLGFQFHGREREETRSVVQCWREEEWAEALSLRISIGFGSSSGPVFWILIWFYICLVRIWLII